MQNNGIPPTDLTTSNNGLGASGDLSEYVFSIWSTATPSQRRTIGQARVDSQLLPEVSDLLTLLALVEKNRGKIVSG